MAAPELSVGAQAAPAKAPIVFKAFEWLMENPYDKDANPSGIINAGVAINSTIGQMLLDKLNALHDGFTAGDLEYGIPYGMCSLRGEVADVVNRHLHPATPVSAESIVVTNGCTSAIEMLAFAMCNPGEHILIPAPCYLALQGDMGMRAQAVATPVTVPLDEVMFTQQIAHFERALADLEKAGGKAKMLFLTTPQNPLGTIYPREVLRAFLRFASEHSLFVVFDEIYALSVFGQSEGAAPFESVLSWTDLDSYIDPASVVVLHGLSKDFGLNGFRVGWVISPWNPALVGTLKCYSPFGYRPTFTDRTVARLLADHEFIDSMLQISRDRLASHYSIATQFLDLHGIKYVPCVAGHFIWMQLPAHSHTRVLRAQGRMAPDETAAAVWTAESEAVVWEHMVKETRVYMPPGQAFFAAEFGWFRLTFAIAKEELEAVLDRLAQLCAPCD
ncbi:hypothetical protein H4R21_005853 [Coemansia helicoidea]|uniref:Uncharacterized protein n=1 Tax=Coemansia helicoidea TaxID=1286919 RepID=A0ACC1KRT9_9FUNG|nr:hypothetical protein H4R21_005853 [Coemansia helicoidea]